MAVRPVEDKELRQLLQEGHTPIDIQWIGTDKNLHRKRNGEKHEILFKSRLVERGGQETAQGTRTDSPAADLEAVNLVISWASSMNITNAYFHGEKLDRLIILKQPAGIPGAPQDRMYVGNCPIYGGKDSGRLFCKRLKS